MMFAEDWQVQVVLADFTDRKLWWIHGNSPVKIEISVAAVSIQLHAYNAIKFTVQQVCDRILSPTYPGCVDLDPRFSCYVLVNC
jgi:hypothetical protein